MAERRNYSSWVDSNPLLVFVISVNNAGMECIHIAIKLYKRDSGNAVWSYVMRRQNIY